MIASTVVDEVRQLLADGGLSQRKIASRIGVSRGTVQAIAQGKRPDYDARRQPADDFILPSGPLRRCPSCGGMVLMPCLLCRVRTIKASRRSGAHRAKPYSK